MRWREVSGLAIIGAFAVVSPAAAKCENNAKSCLEATRFHQRVCARVGSSSARRDCYSRGEMAFDECLKTGRWTMDKCDLNGLAKR